MLWKRATQLTGGVGLLLGLDLLVSSLGLAGSSARDTQDAIDRQFRVKHELFHHALAPNFSGFGQFGRYIYPVRTNDLGYLDSTVRTVAKDTAKPRLVVIGDAHGEGLGFEWDETPAGLLAKARPDVEVLNASVLSYSPIIYLRKVRWLIEQGYDLDHVLVLLDISDIHDETVYVMAGDKVVTRRVGSLAGRGWEARDGAARTVDRMLAPFELASMGWDFLKAGQRHIRGFDAASVFDHCRSAWTYDSANPTTAIHYAGWIEGFTPPSSTCPPLANRSAAMASPAPNIARAIERAEHWMSELHALLAARGIPLSVAVHPWPAQLHHDDRESLQRSVWRNWCMTRCARFVDTFPAFFAHKDRNPQRWYDDLYLRGDVNFSARGNALLAQQLAGVLNTIEKRGFAARQAAQAPRAAPGNVRNRGL